MYQRVFSLQSVSKLLYQNHLKLVHHNLNNKHSLPLYTRGISVDCKHFPVNKHICCLKLRQSVNHCVNESKVLERNSVRRHHLCRGISSLALRAGGNMEVNRHDTRGLATRDMRLPIIYLFTKDDCTLCEDAKLVLQPYMHRFTFEEVDITLPENKDWYEKYKYDIPVFHMHEDFLFQHRVDLDVLEAALKQHENKLGDDSS